NYYVSKLTDQTMTRGQVVVALIENTGGVIGTTIPVFDGAEDTTASYQNATSGVTIDLTTPANNVNTYKSDNFAFITNLVGSAFDDKLTGTSGNNILIGGAGHDILNGGSAGVDTASYATAAKGVIANLGDSTKNIGADDANGDTYVNIDNLTGSSFDDILTGNANANTLTGGDGNDTLDGGAGADAMIGGKGN